MRKIDVFNGDADGVCALHQLRLAEPASSELVTGVKRDINLLERVQAGAGDRITVLDISLDSNRKGLLRLLEAGASIEYFDHHHAGELPRDPNLITHIDLSAGVCTSILVDRHLEGQYRLWAITAAFGDNLEKSARTLAESEGLSETQIGQLSRLGECLNYNGYGDSLEDLHFHPAQLYAEMKPYADPFAFFAESSAFLKLEKGLCEDTAMAAGLQPHQQEDQCLAYVMPDAPWARRVSGVFANRLASSDTMRAHAVLTPNQFGDFTVSVRAPISRPQGADTLCLIFPTGGGRKAAAGINRLPVNELDRFLASFKAQFNKIK
jgi:hypothetical protein